MPVESFTDLDMQQLAERLLVARRRAGLTQTQVAWRADLHLGNYNEIERGKRPGLRVETLYRLCQVLGVGADYLLGLPPQQEDSPNADA